MLHGQAVVFCGLRGQIIDRRLIKCIKHFRKFNRSATFLCCVPQRLQNGELLIIKYFFKQVLSRILCIASHLRVSLAAGGLRRRRNIALFFLLILFRQIKLAFFFLHSPPNIASFFPHRYEPLTEAGIDAVGWNSWILVVISFQRFL